MTNINKARKTFTDLSNPQQLRELNRQLEWVWNQLLGGLPAKALSSDGIRTVVSTVEKTIAKEIEADEIETNILVAALARLMVAQIAIAQIDYAQIVDLHTGNLIFNRGEGDELYINNFQALTSNLKYADIDFSQVKDLIAGDTIITEGAAGELYIERLAATNAMMVSATLGNLVIKGEDGSYHNIVVSADGNIHTNRVEVSDEEIAAGKTYTGKQLVETSIVVDDLNAQSIRGSSAIISEIFTTALTAGKITAGEALIASATIPTLYTTSIEAIGNSLNLAANEYLKLLVSRKNSIFYRETAPTEFVSGDAWIQPGYGKSYLAVGMTGKNTPELDFTSDLCFLYRFDEDSEEYALDMDDEGNLLAYVDNAYVDENGNLMADCEWIEVSPSELHTSFIDIAQDYIRILTGGSIFIGAGGALDVASGSAHFKTGDFTLSILSEDSSEDTVMDFDPDSKVLRVDEVRANNVRSFIPGTTSVTASEIGGLDGLANMLESACYEHVIYVPDYDEISSEPITIDRCDSLTVEIKAAILKSIPPVVFTNTRTNVWLENVKWNCSSKNAVSADSGCICIKNCSVVALNGIVASRHARITWIGEESLTTAGACTGNAFSASEGAEIKVFGVIPSGALLQSLGGTITSIGTEIGDEPEVEPEYQTKTLYGTIGYYGTSANWNGGSMYQGYSNGKGRIYGCMKFTLPSGITSIESATLTLHRVSGAGRGSNVNVTVYGSATDYGSRPTLGTIYANRGNAAATGSSCSLDVSQAAESLLSGAVKQLVLYTGETAPASGKVYSPHYAKFDSAKLKIIYY